MSSAGAASGMSVSTTSSPRSLSSDSVGSDLAALLESGGEKGAGCLAHCISMAFGSWASAPWVVGGVASKRTPDWPVAGSPAGGAGTGSGDISTTEVDGVRGDAACDGSSLVLTAAVAELLGVRRGRFCQGTMAERKAGCSV